MGIFDKICDGIIDRSERLNQWMDDHGCPPDPEREAEKARRAQQERARANQVQKQREHDMYPNTWICPRCRSTNYGGVRCEECGNGNPNLHRR